jgi:hypothetical protein
MNRDRAFPTGHYFLIHRRNATEQTIQELEREIAAARSAAAVKDSDALAK